MDSEPPRESCKILVVDDNIDAADSVVALLDTYGYEACAVYNGAEAVLLAELLHPVLVLLDLDMPEVSGFEIAACIRALAQPENPKLVALTGRGSDADRVLTSAAGFDLHVRKPIACEQLRQLGEWAYRKSA